MQIKALFKKFVAVIDPAGAKKYVTQVSLILVSLFIATNADRFRQRQKDNAKLKEYIQAIKEDLTEELQTCKMNLHDSDRDLKCLERAVMYMPMTHPDSAMLGMEAFGEVFHRGVFRTFPPSTFDIMMQAGEVNLIKDLKLRGDLASVFSFINGTVQHDLLEYDRQTLECARFLGKDLNLTKALYSSKGDIPHIPPGDNHTKNALILLLRTANLRSFHLQNAVEDLEAILPKVEAFEKTLN
jgi:hypothetical protein